MSSFDVSQFVKQFLMEAEERIQKLNSLLLALEKKPQEVSLLKEIKREMHTLKGSARMVGLKEINAIAHRFEDLLAFFETRPSAVSEHALDLMFSGCDTIQKQVKATRDKTAVPIGEELLQKIETCLHSLTGPSSPVANKPQTEPEQSAPGNSGGFSVNQLAKLKAKLTQKKTEPSFPTRVTPTPEKEPIPPELSKKPQETLVTPEVPAITREKQTASQTLSTDEVAMPTAADVSDTVKIDFTYVNHLNNLVSDLVSKSLFLNEIEKLGQVAIEESRKIMEALREKYRHLPDGDEILEAFSLLENEITQINDTFALASPDFKASLTDLFTGLTELKIVPIAQIFNQYQRFVRDLAKQLNKKVECYIRGKDTKLDKTVLEKLNMALLHMIRNAIDHGIETVDERKQKQKKPTGTLIIEAQSHGNRVVILIQDDGQGLDTDKILEKAIQKELVSLEKAKNLSKTEILSLIYQSGFSTQKFITDLSGRGVGMDVVKNVISELGGTISIQSEKDQGTTFRIEIPVSTSSLRAVFVEENGYQYSVPTAYLENLQVRNWNEVFSKNGKDAILIDQRLFYVISLSEVLHGKENNREGEFFLMGMKSNPTNTVLAVSKILYEEEIILKRINELLPKPRFFNGVTTLGKGEIVPVLDFPELLDVKNITDRKVFQATLDKMPMREDSQTKNILLVEDSLITRKMEETILRSAGYDVVTAVNGLDALEKMTKASFHLVVTDVEMPLMDGFELTARIRENPVWEDLPVVIVTSLEKQEDKIRGIQVGANAYITKRSFEQSNLIETIQRLL